VSGSIKYDFENYVLHVLDNKHLENLEKVTPATEIENYTLIFMRRYIAETPISAVSLNVSNMLQIRPIRRNKV